MLPPFEIPRRTQTCLGLPLPMRSVLKTQIPDFLPLSSSLILLQPREPPYYYSSSTQARSCPRAFAQAISSVYLTFLPVVGYFSRLRENLSEFICTQSLSGLDLGGGRSVKGRVRLA